MLKLNEQITRIYILYFSSFIIRFIEGRIIGTLLIIKYLMFSRYIIIFSVSYIKSLFLLREKAQHGLALYFYGR